MGVELRYQGKLSGEGQLDRIIRSLDISELHPKRVDMPYDARYDVSGYALRPDFPLHRDAYLTLARFRIRAPEYGGVMPLHYKGLILNIAPGHEPLSVIFGAYPHRGEWVLDGCTKTQFAGLDSHLRMIGVLDALKSYVPGLRVRDDSGYWTHRDARRAAELFDRTYCCILSMAEIFENSSDPKG